MRALHSTRDHLLLIGSLGLGILFVGSGPQAKGQTSPGDANDPGIIEPCLSATLGTEVRIPNTDQAQNGRLLNLVGPIASQALLGATSLTGHAITDDTDPHRALRDALRDLEDRARAGTVAGMQSAARELEAILLGETQGRAFDGFAQLNFNRGAFAPGHLPGEYKTKVITDSGLTAPGIDGVERKIWEVTVNLLWYDGQFDSDTFLIRIPIAAHRLDTLRVHYRIYSYVHEDFAPTTVLMDQRLEGSVQFPFKGLDSVWTAVDGDSLTEISVDHPPLGLLRGVYTWGWRVHPPRIQFLQPIYEMVNAHTGEVQLEPQGESYAARNRLLSIDDISDAAPEKKMYQVVQSVFAGASAAEVLAMLTQPNTAPRGTADEWQNLAADQRQLPPEAWDVLEAEGIPRGEFGPYRFVTAYLNNELYGQGPQGERIQGWYQGDLFQVKLINLDNHTHYFRNVDFGPGLHDDIATGGFSSGSHSFEIMNFKPTYGAPKVAEVQWRAGWGFRPHFDIIQQQGVFSRPSDQALLISYLAGSGAQQNGFQYSAEYRGGDFRFNPPPFIIGSVDHPSLQRLKESDGSDGLLIGRATEAFGVAKMCSHANHPLGGFCETDISAFNPNGAKNIDTDGDGTPDVLWFPPFLRNPDSQSGGDIIPPTPAWKPFLWINPNNGTLLIDPADPSQGYWADLTFAHGRPVPAGGSLNARIEAPRASAQVFYQFDDLYHDNAIFSPHPSFAPEDPPCSGPTVQLGFSKPGTGGLSPRFEVCGSLAPSGQATFALANALPNASAFLVISNQTSPRPFRGGTLAPADPFLAIAGVNTDPNGGYSFVAPGGLGSFTLTMQFAVRDPGASFNMSFSNALEVTWQN